MWVKTDEGKLCNLEHFHTLEVRGWAKNENRESEGYYDISGNKFYPYTVQGTTHNTWDIRQIALCKTEEEAKLIIDNLFLAISCNYREVDIAELRDPEYGS